MKNNETAGVEQITKNIWRCADGVYRWSYEYDMLRNPTILITVYKVLGLSLGIVYLLTLVIDLFQKTIETWGDLWTASKLFLILAGVFLVLGFLGYLLTAAIFGWKYMVVFEMTDDYVRHIQMAKQVKKAETIGMITALAGLLAKRPTTAGAGLLASAKTVSTSEFDSVEFLKVRRRRHTIHVNQLLDKNQVYAEDEDFDFVEQFIKAHCTKAKIL